MPFLSFLPVGLALIPLALLRVREDYGGHPRLDMLGVGVATTGLFRTTRAIVRTDTKLGHPPRGHKRRL